MNVGQAVVKDTNVGQAVVKDTNVGHADVKDNINSLKFHSKCVVCIRWKLITYNIAYCRVLETLYIFLKWATIQKNIK